MEGQDPQNNIIEAIKIDSKIPHISRRFHIHESIKKSSFSNQYVAEDLEVDATLPNVIMYYFLKQNIYHNESEFNYALIYYQKLQSYCKQPLAKPDIVKLYQVYQFADPSNNYFELVMLFELGEADRIDIDQIQVQQITKFLKNVCILLQDLKSKNDLYQGNICIKNIVLTDNELKISGFKPIFLDNPDYSNWKTDLCRKYSHFRLDIYMIGLIWLRMMGSNPDEITKTAKTVEELSKKINEQYEQVLDDKKTNIVTKFLDLENSGDLNLDDAVLLFDEYFILETRKKMQTQNASNGSSNNNGAMFGGGSTSDDGRGSIALSRDSLTKEQNLFTKGLNDSNIDNMTFKNEEFLKKDTDVVNDQHRAEGDFSIRDDHSFVGRTNSNAPNIEDINNAKIVDKRHSENLINERNNSLGLENINLTTGSEKDIKNDHKNHDSSNLSFKRGDESFDSVPIVDNNNDVFENDAQGNHNSAQYASKFSKLSNPDDESASTGNIKKNGSSNQGSISSFAKKKSPSEVNMEKADPIEVNEADSNKDSKKNLDEQKLNKNSIGSKKMSFGQIEEEVQNRDSKLSSQSKPSIKESIRAKSNSKSPIKGDLQPIEKKSVENKKKSSISENDNLQKNIDHVADFHSPKETIAQKKRSRVNSVEKPQIIDKTNNLSTQKAQEEENNEEKIELPRKKMNKREKLEAMNKRLENIALPLNYFDHARNIGLHIKKAVPINVVPVELSEDQKIKIQRQIENNKQKKLEVEKEKIENDKHLIEQKHQEKIKQQEKLREKIEIILEKKQNDRKIQSSAVFPQNEKSVKVQKVEEDYPELKSTLKSLPISKGKDPKRANYVRQNNKSPAHFSNHKQKDNLFTYNSDLQNKNVTFRQVVTKADAYIKSSRSPSPNTTKKIPNTFENSFTRPMDDIIGSNIPVSQNLTGNLSNNLKPSSVKVKNVQNPETQTRQLIFNLDFLKKDPLNNKDYLFDKSKFDTYNKFEAHLPKAKLNQTEQQTLETIAKNLKEQKPEKVFDLLNAKKDSISINCYLKGLNQLLDYFDSKKDQNGVRKVLIDFYDVLSKEEISKNQPHLIQDLINNIVDLELKNKNNDNALTILNSSIFDDKSFDQSSHDERILQALKGLKREKDMADFYERKIDQNVANSFQNLDIAKLFVNISQTIECLNNAGDNLEIVKFYNKIMSLLQKLNKLNQNLRLNEHDYENLIECFVLNTLRFANKNSNYNLCNFVIGEAVKNKQVDFIHNFNETDRKEYAELILEFCWHLKSLVNYGTYKENYIKYLTYTKDVIKQCDLNAENLKTNLVVNFNRGIFYLKEENYKKAESLFDKCLVAYYAFFKEADQDLYIVLFNLGQTLYKNKKLSESVYFFNRVLDEQCKNFPLQEKSLKKLGLIFFKKEHFSKTILTLEEFLISNFETRAQKDYFKFLTLYFISCEKVESDEFGKFFKKLAVLKPEQLDQKLYWYFKTFKSIQKIHEEHHVYKDNKKYIQLLEELVTNSPGSELNAKRLFNITGLIFYNFIENDQEKGKTPTESLIRAFFDLYSTIEENAVQLNGYIDNLLLVFIHTLPLFKDRVHNHEYRQKIFESVKEFIPKSDKVQLLTNLGRVLISGKDHSSEPNFRNVDDHHKNNELNNRPGKLHSELVVGYSRPSNIECVCLAEFNTNPVLRDLVKSFLKQIKNMLFLDVVDNVLTYYLRFEKSLIDLNLNYQKYNYIKQLIRFHIAKGANVPVDRSSFVALLDQLFATSNICIHDLKLILVILEGFKDISYMSLFSLYLDQFRPAHAEVVFKSEFFDQFMRKSAEMTTKLFEQINNAKYYELENCYFMHHLESQNFINVEKQLSFKLFLRSRHDLLNDARFREIFSKYIDQKDLNLFDVKYHIYSSIVKLLKKGDEKHLSIISQFNTGFAESINKTDLNEEVASVLLYEILLICNLYKFEQNEKTVEVFTNAVYSILLRFNTTLNYTASRVFSMMGNIFFKYGYVEDCLNVKNKALVLLAEEAKIKLSEPAFIAPETKEMHKYHMTSFIIACCLEQNDIVTAISLSDQLEKVNTDDQKISFNRLIIRCLILLAQDKYAESLKNVYDAISFFSKMKLDVFLNKMYQAILDKITLLVVLKSENREGLELIQRKSKLSISKLYDLPI